MKMRMSAAVAVLALAIAGLGGTAQAAERAESSTVKAATQTADQPAATAAARAGARNVKYLWLRYPAPAGSESCTSRTITLGAGKYRWETDDSSPSTRERTITLAAGKYRWVDCIHYFERASGIDVYRHESGLQSVRTGGWAHLPDSWLQNRQKPGLVFSWYGSTLTRL
ncbi:hypothetical protein [Jiangella alba]|uniref:Uncharacterized protein n=1 Tax=Jiangella alba TaxID=561176 RepID=A0A1H5PUY8_9ACTN|nr:hypothetical protein [Jiangella alba]SEF16827.1 hypothetical protein SAMN04488561_5558 [Jiangella alba]